MKEIDILIPSGLYGKLPHKDIIRLNEMLEKGFEVDVGSCAHSYTIATKIKLYSVIDCGHSDDKDFIITMMLANIKKLTDLMDTNKILQKEVSENNKLKESIKNIKDMFKES